MGFFAVAMFASTSAAFAACSGYGDVQHCTDDTGNEYTVRRYGDRTVVDGYNPQTGRSWSETARRDGDRTRISGYAANGESWDETIVDRGNGRRHISGTDSHGKYYDVDCDRNGCN
jgi:hypothetical protein